MKMSEQHYAQLRLAILSALPKIPTAAQYAARDPVIPRIDRAKDTAMRHRWDALWAARFDCKPLYDAGLNDNHIDTALRAIIVGK